VERKDMPKKKALTVSKGEYARIFMRGRKAGIEFMRKKVVLVMEAAK
jgi:hypothetical protein